MLTPLLLTLIPSSHPRVRMQHTQHTTHTHTWNVRARMQHTQHPTHTHTCNVRVRMQHTEHASQTHTCNVRASMQHTQQTTQTHICNVERTEPSPPLAPSPPLVPPPTSITVLNSVSPRLVSSDSSALACMPVSGTTGSDVRHVVIWSATLPGCSAATAQRWRACLRGAIPLNG